MIYLQQKKKHLKINNSEEIGTIILRNIDICVKSECTRRKTETKK